MLLPELLSPKIAHGSSLAMPGCSAPGHKPGTLLRVAVAECLRDIAATDPDKVVELLGLVQVKSSRST